MIEWIIDAVLIAIIYSVYRLTSKGDSDYKCLKLNKEFARLRTELEVSNTELWEYIEATLTPLSMRLSTRLKRQEKKENKDLSTKKGGILHGIPIVSAEDNRDY